MRDWSVLVANTGWHARALELWTLDPCWLDSGSSHSISRNLSYPKNWSCLEPWKEINHCHRNHFDIKLGIPYLLWHVIVGNARGNCFISKGPSLNAISHSQCHSNIRLSLFPDLYYHPAFDTILQAIKNWSQGEPEDEADMRVSKPNAAHVYTLTMGRINSSQTRAKKI